MPQAHTLLGICTLAYSRDLLCNTLGPEQYTHLTPYAYDYDTIEIKPETCSLHQSTTNTSKSNHSSSPLGTSVSSISGQRDTQSPSVQSIPPVQAIEAHQKWNAQCWGLHILHLVTHLQGVEETGAQRVCTIPPQQLVRGEGAVVDLQCRPT